MEGLREVWSKSIRERKPEQLINRLQALGPFIDCLEPIAFTGSALLGQLVDLPADVAGEAADFRNRINTAWASLRNKAFIHETWLAVGRDLERDMQLDEAWWEGRIQSAIELEKRIEVVERQFALPHDRAQAIRNYKQGLAPPFKVQLRPSVEARFDALRSYLASKLATVMSQRPQRNDYLDGRHLFHLGWPAFLATSDLKLLDAVDASNTRQRPWVRSPVELVHDPVARCPPWGCAADEVARRFQRLPREAHRLRLDSWRSSLPRSA